ncbi:MAG: RagB/SusD family nutrient uptake outer membrane protein [Flavobacteriales bacterium]|nr:RagB/SusD family nutrient uptake outer membrane protein [Flavobacteriales bacterium]
MKKIFLFIMVSTAFWGCDKLLEFEPGDVVIDETALETPEDAQRLLNSNYDVLGNLYDGRVQNIAELLSDNLAFPDNNNDFIAVFNRETNFFTTGTGSVYTDLYRAVYRGNALIQNFDLIEGLTEDEQTRMEAEVRFIRALCHWQAVKLWAQPYGWTANNTHLGVPIRREASQEPLLRSTVGEVYDFILEDLQYARSNLPEQNDVYADRNSATALLANVYFLMGDYANAASLASEVIESGQYTLDEDIDRYEVETTNTETIFGIVGSLIDNRSENFRDNYRSDNNPDPNLTFSADVAELLSLNASDARNEWVTAGGDLNLVNKFNGKEFFNIPILYLTTMKLMRAEALAHSGGNLSTAIEDINDIRDRAFGEGLNDLDPSSTTEEVIAAARAEYRKETLCEGVWIDQLKRMGVAGENITVRGAPYDCPGMAIQFPNGETTSEGFILNEEGGCL